MADSHVERFALLYVKLTRSGFKIQILVHHQGGTEFQTAGIRKYVEDLKRGLNIEIEPKDNFEAASNPMLFKACLIYIRARIIG